MKVTLPACWPSVYFSCSTGGVTGPEPGEAPVELQLVAAGLAFPLYVTSPPQDASRLFIVEKRGTIRIVRNGVLQPGFVLDLRGRVTTGSEQGLLGMAFHPRDGRVVVNYTTAGTTSGGRSRISTFTASANPDVLDPASGRVILEVDQPYSNHNGGHVAFGPDGFLYIGFGDGGSGGDPQGHGQDQTDLLGSILRIDIDHAAPYTIPQSNPLAGDPVKRKELWNWGLRNPWRFSFDRTLGTLYIADVGQSAREEVDVQPANSAGGENYGWAIMEGRMCYRSAGCSTVGLTLPVLEYTHADGCSITGGYVYRGTAIPEIQGLYFYSDYCDGWVRSFEYSAGTARNPRNWPALAPGGRISSFGEDASGELYIVEAEGRVFKLVPRE
jgi:glucose/arabinose dehydrogenase